MKRKKTFKEIYFLRNTPGGGNYHCGGVTMIVLTNPFYTTYHPYYSEMVGYSQLLCTPGLYHRCSNPIQVVLFGQVETFR